MIRIRRLGGMGLAVGLLALTAACDGETRPAAAPTETTSAQVTYDPQQVQRDMAQLKHERDTAQQQLGDQIQRNDEQAKRLTAETREKEERVELARSASSSIEAAQSEIRASDKKLAKATGKKRLMMDKSLSAVKEKLATVELKASRIGLDHGPDWPGFKDDLANQISELQSAVEAARTE